MIDRIKLSAALVQRRNEVKQLLGDSFDAKVDEFRPLFAETMERHDCTEIDALLHITREHGPISPLLGSVLIAVAVDLMEARK